MPLFNPAPQKIEIKLYWKEAKTTSGLMKPVILDDEKALEQIAKNKKSQEPQPVVEGQPVKEIKPVPPEDMVECLTTYWKGLSWQDNNSITEKASYYNQLEGYHDLNVWRYRDLRLKNCLLEWDLKDPNGKPVPVSEDVINMLPTEVIMALLNKYDAAVSISDTDKKK